MTVTEGDKASWVWRTERWLVLLGLLVIVIVSVTVTVVWLWVWRKPIYLGFGGGGERIE